MPFTLSDHDRVLLEQKRRFEKKRERFVQISIPLALHNGHSPSQVADILGIDVSTVHRYRARFQEADDVADYLRVRRLGSKPRLNDEQLAELRAELTENFYRSASQIDRFIRQRFDVRLSLRQIRRVLVEQLNFRFKKTRLIPAKADLDEQRRFLTDVLEPLIESSRQAGEPLYFCDAAHPAYNARPCSGWILRGKNHYIKSVPGRLHVNLSAAVNLHNPCDAVVREDRRINAATSIALFRALEKRYRHGTIHVVCDNVRYYRCAKVCNWLEGRRINLVFLPPYSPNLNLAERLWKLMRAEVIDAIYYENFAAFRDALLGFFRYLGDQTARLTTLMTPRFHIEEVRVAG